MGFREVDLYLVCLLMLGSGWGGVVGWGCRGGVGWALGFPLVSFPLYFPGKTPWKSSNFGL